MGFIKALGDKAVVIINDHSLSGDESQAKFVSLFNDSFDVAGIGRYVLGHYWDHATPQQIDNYLAAFKEYIVATYSTRFTRYTGQSFRVIDSHDDSDNSMVSSEIAGGADGQPTHIDWVVHKTPDGYRIEDVVLDKVSMMQAQRAEFTSVIVHADGSIDGLIAALRQKTGKGAVQSGSTG
ncbi:MAG TPA: ABC transporter substrate-binding protein [Aliidongia sp.]|nr:ABC transporter substrate-binding protein [Aliidongia sp.]